MNRLKELRLAHGYKSQQELASVLFVNQTAVSQWERGVTLPSSQMLLKLSKMYGVSTDYLLGNSEETQVEQKKQSPAVIDEGLLDAELIARLASLTPEEQNKVDAFVQGMIASRADEAFPST